MFNEDKYVVIYDLMRVKCQITIKRHMLTSTFGKENLLILISNLLSLDDLFLFILEKRLPSLDVNVIKKNMSGMILYKYCIGICHAGDKSAVLEGGTPLYFDRTFLRFGEKIYLILSPVQINENT
jgi:hypothetical protein